MNRKDILIVSALKQEIPVLKKGGIIYSLENYDVLYTTQVEKDIADSGAAEPTISTSGGYGGSS